MKITDNTPYRNDGGKIDIFGRLMGTLKFGLSWYARIEAQEAAISALDKNLGQGFILLRNIKLYDTDIDLPMVLIGPPGIYLINVTHERGVYRARDDEWGKVSGDVFVPAGINQVQRTVKLGRVLQLYLDRAGYKGELIVEPILMAADPGMHIESVRPVARIVMSDALERFAISMNQAHPILTAAKISESAHVILNGAKKKAPAAPVTVGPDTTADLFPPEEPEDPNPVFSADSLGFSFSEQGEAQQEPSGDRAFEAPGLESPVLPFIEETGPESQPETANKPKTTAPGKRGLFGMTFIQLLILGGILLFWLCAVTAFAIYIYINLNV